jgi:2-oxoisovalerate dehydrogenase E1 component
MGQLDQVERQIERVTHRNGPQLLDKPRLGLCLVERCLRRDGADALHGHHEVAVGGRLDLGAQEAVVELLLVENDFRLAAKALHERKGLLASRGTRQYGVLVIFVSVGGPLTQQRGARPMPLREVARFSIPHLQVLDESGHIDADLDPRLDDQTLVELYRAMVLAREADGRMLKLQRQGRIGTFPPATGQEAIACGATLALKKSDWFVGAYRELGGKLMRGEPLEKILLYYNGYEEGNTLPRELRTLPGYVILASQLPHAVGIGYAMQQLKEKETAVLAFFGDGATSQGDFHEALNFAGVWRAPVIFVCQNNHWAISVPRRIQTHSETIAQKAVAYGMPGIQVDGNDVLAVYRAVHEALERARAGGGPTLIEALTYRLLMHTTADDPTKYRSEEEVQEWWKREPIPRFRSYLEKKGIWNADLQAGLEARVREEVDRAVKAFERETTFKPDAPFDHVFGTSHPEIEDQRAEFLADLGRDQTASTGKGAAAADPPRVTGGAPLRPPPPAEDAPKLNMVQAINLALRQEMGRDERVVVLGEDVGRDGGVFRVTDGLLDLYGAQRVMDTPLAESAIFGAAIGMALAGLRPIPEMQFDGFSYLMFPQLEGNASRFRARTQGVWNVPLVVRMPYGAGVRALEHHSESREATYAHLPGVKVVIPSGPRNARALLVAAIRDPDPVVFMEPKRSYRAFREEVPDEEETMEIGRAQVVKEGSDLTVVSWGAMMRPTLQAVVELEEQRGATIELIDLLTIAPLDGHAIVESVKKTGRCVVVQEASRTLSVAAEIVARINDRALLYLEAPVRRVTNYDVLPPYFGRELMYLPSAEHIKRAMEETLEF